MGKQRPRLRDIGEDDRRSKRGVSATIWLVVALTFASGLVAALRMSETLNRSMLPNEG